MYQQYEKGRTKVWVRENLKGRQKEFCMCWDCAAFRPEADDRGCPIIKDVLDLAARKTIVLPVWECPEFIEK
jgi:hypothetical protein